MKKIIIPIIIAVLFVLFCIVFFVPKTKGEVIERPDCFADNLDRTDADWCKEMMFERLGADLIADKCPACPACPTLTLRELIKEKIVELDPIGESSNRTYKINDTSNYKLMLDDGKIYEKDQLIEITPVSINK